MESIKDVALHIMYKSLLYKLFLLLLLANFMKISIVILWVVSYFLILLRRIIYCKFQTNKELDLFQITILNRTNWENMHRIMLLTGHESFKLSLINYAFFYNSSLSTTGVSNWRSDPVHAAILETVMSGPTSLRPGPCHPCMHVYRRWKAHACTGLVCCRMQGNKSSL